MAAQDCPHPFTGNVRVTCTETHLVVESDGVPDHATGTFPNRDNPNPIRRQGYVFRIPRRPQVAEAPTELPMGPIGVGINGVPFYNPYNAERRDAVTGPYAEIFDQCQGHPDRRGRYHYHQHPICISAGQEAHPGNHSPPIGYAFDGFGIYGPKGDGGRAPADLDRFNGHADAERGYHYHVTDRFPYVIGGYRGVVEAVNLDRPGRRPPPDGPRPFFPPPPPRPRY
jgi:hypothetical protein